MNTVTEAVNLSWDDINVFVTRGQAGSCCRKRSSEGDVLHILKNGEFKRALKSLLKMGVSHRWFTKVYVNHGSVIVIVPFNRFC